MLFCPQDQTTYHSKQLRSLVPDGGTFGYDIIVEAGLAFFVRCRNNREIIEELATKNVSISEREISYLGRKFIFYLALAPKESKLRLRELQAKRGLRISFVTFTSYATSEKICCWMSTQLFSKGKTLYIQPQRTNNILERFFRGEKRRSRKKSGTASLSKALKTVLADTPLVQNLNNHEYIDIILNGCSNLAERFSQIDARLVQKELENAKNSHEKILPAIRELVKKSDLIMRISLLFSSVAK